MADVLRTRFSELVTDFVVTSKAMERLGEEAHLVNFPGTMNLRDALAHICDTINLYINNPASTNEHIGQIACAREHIRRAAVEPIQALFTERYRTFDELYAT